MKKKWLRKKKSKEERIGILNREKKRIEKQIKREQQGGFPMDERDIRDALADLSEPALRRVIDDANDFLKEKKEENKLKKEESFRNNVGEGDKIAFYFKGERTEGYVSKINNSSFTAAFEKDGETKNQPIRFHLFIEKIADAGEIEDDIEEAV